MLGRWRLGRRSWRGALRGVDVNESSHEQRKREKREEENERGNNGAALNFKTFQAQV